MSEEYKIGNRFPTDLGYLSPSPTPTLEFYARNASAFAEGTLTVDFSETQQRFLKYLPAGALILDFGCGAGRDTKAFLDQGYVVEPVDGSPELCRLAAEFTGVPVRQMLFRQLEELARYDGIWACASVLHLHRNALPEVFRRMAVALKQDGILYVSFKYGDYTGMRNGRYFTDLNEESFAELLKETNDFCILESWVSEDVRPGRSGENWLNAILRRKETVI